MMCRGDSLPRNSFPACAFKCAKMKCFNIAIEERRESEGLYVNAGARRRRAKTFLRGAP